MKLSRFTSLILPLLFLSIGCTQSQKSANTITPEQLKQKIDNHENMILIDVRTQPEYTGELGHIKGTVLLPVQDITSWISNYENDKDKEIIMICRSGNRSGRATQYFLDNGFKDVYNMEGGMIGWNKAGYPVEK
ncbi:MAG: rhodanese-like domain-containing protein [Calditrichia bacterium]